MIATIRYMGRTRTKSVKQLSATTHQSRLSTKLFSTTTAVAKKKEQHQEPNALHCWGTSNQGTIPTNDVLEKGRESAEAGGSNKSLADMFKKKNVMGNATEIDVKNAFGIGKSSTSVSTKSCFKS
jgi:hypothetical protein